ncbi:MAG: addiction module toxin, HicA family [Candidatus Aminicenantes bacterium]|nr:addiction module toxin, HicA family [Candidatus Aminicenantes bacterium]
MKQTKLPALSGFQLIRLLKKDGWEEKRRARHGMSLTKKFGKRTRVTIVPTTRASLPTGTLMDILGSKQTKLKKSGLLNIINKYRV